MRRSPHRLQVEAHAVAFSDGRRRTTRRGGDAREGRERVALVRRTHHTPFLTTTKSSFGCFSGFWEIRKAVLWAVVRHTPRFALALRRPASMEGEARMRDGEGGQRKRGSCLPLSWCDRTICRFDMCYLATFSFYISHRSTANFFLLGRLSLSCACVSSIVAPFFFFFFFFSFLFCSTHEIVYIFKRFYVSGDGSKKPHARGGSGEVKSLHHHSRRKTRRHSRPHPLRLSPVVSVRHPSRSPCSTREILSLFDTRSKTKK